MDCILLVPIAALLGGLVCLIIRGSRPQTVLLVILAVGVIAAILLSGLVFTA